MRIGETERMGGRHQMMEGWQKDYTTAATHHFPYGITLSLFLFVIDQKIAEHFYAKTEVLG